MPAEIAVRQLAGLFHGLSEEGISPAEAMDGVDSPAIDLDDIFARMDWEDYARILENAQQRCNPEKLRQIGAASIYLDDAYLFRANINLGFDDPMQALAHMCTPTGMFRAIVPCIEVELEITGKRSCVLKTRMQQGYRPCRAHHELSAGTISEIPRIMYERPASVDLAPHHDGVDYHVQFARPAVLGLIRRRWQRGKSNRTFLDAVGEVFIELGKRQANFQQESQRRSESEEKLRHTEKMEALGQLTGGVAHDFNNLLFVIQGNLDLLRPKLVDEDSQSLFEAADSAVQRGSDLTKQLLSFGRHASLSPETVDLNNAVREMESLLRRTLGKQITIETVLSAGLWDTNIDRGLLQNAIVNLAVNARDAMPQGGRLTIETANVGLDDDHARSRGNDVEPGRYVMLSLTDTGIGMPKQVAARAFDPFFTTKAVGQGSGLGLAMVYGFSRQSDGIVRIYSEEGIGTSVKVYLPEALNEIADGSPAAFQAEEPGNGETILIVEDDPDVRKTIALQLSDLGYRTVIAADATSAMQVLESHDDVDAMLTDIVLPGAIRGPELAKLAIRSRPSLGIVYMSGYPDGAAAGSNGLSRAGIHLAKPFHRTDLSCAIRRALG